MATERDPSVLDRRTRFALWIRRPSAWVEIGAWAALVAFVVCTIGPALLGHGTFLNTGLLSRYTPWGESLETTANSSNILTSDTLDSVTPQTTLLAKLAHEGVFGAWNPFVAGGVELGGVPNSGAWSPLSLPWWILPFTYAAGAVKFLEIVVGTVGMSLLLRRWGVPRAGWPIASLVFASSGFMVAWSNWPQTRVAAFIPLLFWAIDRAAVELRKRDVIGVGVAVACMLLGGFPAVVGYSLFVGALYFLARTIVAHRAWRPVIGSGIIAVVGIGFGVVLAAWQLLPFAVSASNLVDFGGRGQHGGSGLGSRPMVSSWIPDINFLGSSGAAWSLRNPVEEYSYVGIAAVVLIATAVLVRPAVERVQAMRATPLAVRRTNGVVAIVAGTLAFSVVLVFLGGPILAAARELPVFDTNPIGRARVVVGFFAAVTAGIGFGRIAEPQTVRDELARFRSLPRGRRAWRIVTVVLVGLFALCIGLQTALALGPVPDAYLHQTKLEILHVGILGALAALAVLLAWSFRSRIVVVVAGLGVAALVVVPAIDATRGWWPIASNDSFYPSSPGIEYLQKHMTAQDRYATTGSATLPGSGSYYGIRSVTGHAFQTKQWKELMQAVDPDTYPTATYLTFSPDKMSSLVDSGILDRYSTKYVVADPSAPVAGTTEDGAAQTKWADLTASSPSVDSASHTGPVNGITLTGPPALTTSDDGMTLKVAVVDDATGEPITTTTSWVPGLGGPRNVALRGSDIADGTSWHLRVTVTGQDSLVPIGTDDQGKAVASITRPADGTGSTVVHTGDMTIYRQAGALDRVRWASTQLVEASSAARVRTLADQSLPDDTVVLTSPTSHRAGGDATVTLRDGTVNETVADVDADGGGWLVVADSLRRPGWSATVDGTATDLVAADDAGGAVWVPKGKHTVRLSYSVPDVATGWTITGAGVVVAIAACAIVLVRRRRRRRDA